MQPDLYNIREVHDKDLSYLLEWRNHPDVRKFMLTQHVITLDEHLSWFQRRAQDDSCKQMVVENYDEPIGFVQYDRVTVGGIIDWSFHVKPGSPKGTGRGLGGAALNYAFRQLCVHKVCGQVLGNNMASIGFHEKMGFIKEGQLREQVKLNGKYYDICFYGLLDRDWERIG